MKALVGSLEQRPYRLLAEVTALRTRVAELQEELALAHKEIELLRAAQAQVEEREVALT